jgi:MFS family permease
MTDTHAPSGIRPDVIPRGYVPTVTLSYFGLYLAGITPLIGGLSVKLQHLVGLAHAPAALGLIAGVSSIVALVVQPLIGRLSDRSTSRFGMRKPWLVVGIAGLVLSLIAAGLAPNVPSLLLAMVFGSVFANFAYAAQAATLSDQVPEAKRGGVSGLLGAAGPMGILVGAVLLAVLPTDFLRFAVPAAFALILGYLFVFTLRDRIRATAPTQPLNLRELLLSFVFNPRKHPDFGWAWLSKLLILLGYGSVTGYLTLYLGNAYGMNTTQQLAFNAIANIIAVGALVLFSIIGGFISDRIRRRKPFVFVGGLLIALGVGIVAASPIFHGGGLGVILVGELVTGIGAGLFFAVDQALCIAALPNQEDVAKDLGVLNIANTLPGTLGPFLTGVILIPIGNAIFPSGGYVFAFILGALFAVAGSIAVTRMRQVR